MAELKLSEALEDNEKKRLDSGYFLKQMLETEQRIRSYSQGYDELGEIFSRFSKGIFDINASYYTESGIPFLRIGNLSKTLISEGDDLAYIPEEIHSDEIKTEILRGDIVISKTAYPAAAISYLERANTSQDTIATSLSTYGKDNYISEFVVVYLNSCFGKLLSLRQFQGNIQMHLGLDDGRKIPIIRASLEFQEKIRTLVLKAYAVGEKSRTNLQQAETLLLSALGLEQWQPPEALTYERSAKEVFEAGRLDAEYFHPAKKTALAQISDFASVPVSTLFSSIRELWNPSEAEATLEVQNYDLTAALQPFLDPQEPFTEAREIGSTKKVFQKGDLVVSRLRSYLKEIAVVSHESKKMMVGSSEFIVLRPAQDFFTADALGLYLRSEIPQIILKWSQDGANHPRFNQEELLRIPVPEKIVDMNDELTRISVNIREAHRTSSQLLEMAKRAVEMAIEESEAAALTYLAAHAPALA